jgi:ElaA protein|tara:strand:+ start:1419 stop:1919 length:501 start_codon:yes stop_codon:yes gene_type:complete
LDFCFGGVCHVCGWFLSLGVVIVNEPAREIRVATFDGLNSSKLYEILALRVSIFIVEQNCAYQELDDLDQLAMHYWIDDSCGLVSCLRVIDEGAVRRIGRVVTRRDSRSQGLAGKLIDEAVGSSVGPWALSAQAHLEKWYGNYGFERSGVNYLEDDILHLPMLRMA